MRIYYLFPLVVFILVIGALCRENKTQKRNEKITEQSN